MRRFTPRYTIRDLQELAGYNGGRCLSKEYRGYDKKYTWQCEKGHTWDARVSIIKQGGWCPQCADEERKQAWLIKMQDIAASRGGKCISDEYINSYTKLTWQCSKGHVWDAPPYVINRGSWCPDCSYDRKKLSIQEMQNIAEKRGGKCLSEKYINSKTKLKWQCSKGHVWEATPGNIKAGDWCPVCSRHISVSHAVESRRSRIQKEMHLIAKKNNGKCLSEKYINKRTKLEWQCDKGHIWKATFLLIKHGSWCPQCRNEQIKNHYLNNLKTIAIKKGGKCLSQEYINSRTKLIWQCEKGHKWETTPNNINRGLWCPVCAKERISKNIGKERESLQTS